MRTFCPSSSGIKGGVTAPRGFKASAAAAGIKHPGRNDVALLVSEPAAAVAGVFTTNMIRGATVTLCRDRLRGGKASAVVINSGNANACNGPRGTADAEKMARLAARALRVPPRTVFVCSTGTIGIPMPMDRVARGISLAAGALSASGGGAAARAIMTTDTVDKQVALEIAIDGRPVRIGGMAKGSGMIEPNMATMLAFLTTDAAVTRAALQKCLAEAVNESFNRITVDGDQSCNDTMLLLANGAAGNRPLNEAHPQWGRFRGAVMEAALTLAFKIVKDGEGATKFVTVRVRGAASKADAGKAARAVANSLLVKTSWFGCDPNWGRVIDAVGYSGARVKESLVNISYDSLPAVIGGRKCARTSLKALEKVLRRGSFTLDIDLRLGKARDTVYTCDCSLDYVRINAEYMT